jgi:hypothetical protein
VNWKQTLLTFLAWLMVTCLSFVGLLLLIVFLAWATNSGPAGSCGPSGPIGTLLIPMALAAIPASIIFGVYAASRWNRHRSAAVKKA